ncbi:SurA N-terminal domain-containing protein [Flavobacteriaceae bacterium]|nr:SurA N-terminal domain-containing protein [Flavobacteriaceae bacterium]
MAVLGQIRKRSIFLIIVIGMALFAFVISGVFTSNGGFGSNKPIGEINGEEINYETFNMMVEQAQNAYGLNILNAVNLAWDQGIKNQALLQELDKLGIDAGKDQLEQIISSDQSIVLNPLFQNEIGLFDFNKFSSYISQLKSSNPTLYDQWRFQELNIISLAKQKIYFDLIKSSVIYTDVESNIQYHLENDKVNIEYLRIPYDEIPDSIIQIKDSEIFSYLKNNRDSYEKGEFRKVDYVFIPDAASSIDENNLRTGLEQLRDGFSQLNPVSNTIEDIIGFKDVNDYSEFIEIYSDVRWDSIFKTKQEISGDFSDILFGLRKGEVFGPYRDGNTFKISRMIDKKRDGNLNKVLLADVVKEIVPSNESSNNNYRKASQAEFDANSDLPLNSSDQSLFIDSFNSFEEFDSGLPGVENSRQVIKWLYEDQTRAGDVKRFTLNDGYLVAKAISFNKKSLPNVDDVRDEVSKTILEDKKFEFLLKKYKGSNDIDLISQDYEIELERATAVTQNDPILVGAGSEPYIIGSSFSLDVDETSNLLRGNNGIYMVRLISKDTAEDISIGEAISNSLSDREVERISTLIPQVLESKAEIVDNRSLYY